MTPRRGLTATFVLMLSACSISPGGDAAGTGGSPGAGGTSSQGGTTASGGLSGSGGTSASGGISGSGGATTTGGQTSSGGTTTATGGRSSSGGTTAVGGTTGSGGLTGSGGTASGSGGAAATGGQPGTGGANGTGGRSGRDAGPDAPQGTGGAGTGGSPGTGGGGGATSDAGASGAKPSAGCGKTPTLAKSVPPPSTKMNYITLTSGGQSRRYLLWYPDNYDNTRPYRLVISYHWYSGSASQVFDCKTEGISCYTTQTPFYGLLNLANDSTIFIAPDGTGNPLGWPNGDGAQLVFTDDILKQVENDLCIDTSRIFANGFSYGGGMSFAIACDRADVFRAVAVYAGAQLSGCKDGSKPIAYYASHGLDDGTCTIAGGRTLRDRFVKNNGCTAQSPPEPANNSGSHICTSYEGCTAGYPVRWCAFDGSNGHDPSPKDPGQSATWNPGEVWKFFTQF